MDNTFAVAGFVVTNGVDTCSATAKDSYGSTSVASLTVSLPATSSFTYQLNDNLLYDGLRPFNHEDENQLICVR